METGVGMETEASGDGRNLSVKGLLPCFPPYSIAGISYAQLFKKNQEWCITSRGTFACMNMQIWGLVLLKSYLVSQR